MGDTLNGDRAFFAEDRVSMVLATQSGFAPPAVERLSARFGRRADRACRVDVEVSRAPIRGAAILDAERTIYSTREESEP